MDPFNRFFDSNAFPLRLSTETIGFLLKTVQLSCELLDGTCMTIFTDAQHHIGHFELCDGFEFKDLSVHGTLSSCIELALRFSHQLNSTVPLNFVASYESEVEIDFDILESASSLPKLNIAATPSVVHLPKNRSGIEYQGIISI